MLTQNPSDYSPNNLFSKSPEMKQEEEVLEKQLHVRSRVPKLKGCSPSRRSEGTQAVHQQAQAYPKPWSHLGLIHISTKKLHMQTNKSFISHLCITNWITLASAKYLLSKIDTCLKAWPFFHHNNHSMFWQLANCILSPTIMCFRQSKSKSLANEYMFSISTRPWNKYMHAESIHSSCAIV